MTETAPVSEAHVRLANVERSDSALLTARHAAELLGVSESTVRRGIAARTIPVVRLVEGGDRLIPRAFVRELSGDAA